MSKFTDGPWRYAESWRSPIGRLPRDIITNSDGNVFYGYYITGSNEHNGMILPTLASVHNFPDNMEANARLIAASPQMHGLLKAFIAATEGVFECGHIRTEAMTLMKGIEDDVG